MVLAGLSYLRDGEDQLGGARSDDHAPDDDAGAGPAEELHEAVVHALHLGARVAREREHDDIGLHLSQRGNAFARSLGHGLLWLMPRLLNMLSLVGTAAMLWVGGGIVLHGMEEFHFTRLPEIVHHNAVDAGNLAGGLAEVVAKETPAIQHIAPWLTLDGLRIIWELNQP